MDFSLKSNCIQFVINKLFLFVSNSDFMGKLLRFTLVPVEILLKVLADVTYLTSAGRGNRLDRYLYSPKSFEFDLYVFAD